ncbi:MAG TPA: (2Fe-2S) ferredoxin domain-containing protein [Candidatus Limousia pullorum]|uniref:(2Fe-2S) ferredoxin domain-containing protein n=1 Tax=Candidatus Limousia pullorum TaxID=2840860 RepID=A0A9D1S836_9FIRM|nr:(2Fe-2S) ferredoxin domain-containing protein [Anaeromassilibacillus sp. An172]MEE0762477.1 (2Fe-2S) ferredoxin domain-containing protein [Acutalibacteraceae bacterium]OUP74856.1 ferredoxin [Anaeromassilibacillus sp. An172]HIU50002.1 (2Fe-2S) ferredoxin domain-containing protein [Candidatus Limousia pullorum]
MKSLAELQAIRDRAKAQLNMRQDNPDAIRVLVGMATCGIAAGARPVLNAFTEEIAKRGLTNVTVTQTGCIGICQFEPVVEIEVPGEDKVTYVKMTPEKVAKVVNDHIVNKNVVTEYTIGANS